MIRMPDRAAAREDPVLGLPISTFSLCFHLVVGEEGAVKGAGRKSRKGREGEGEGALVFVLLIRTLTPS